MVDQNSNAPSPPNATANISAPDSQDQATQDAASHDPPVDRTELLNKARAFLSSPQVRHEDYSVKRRFLAEKGLNTSEIDGLLQELPPQAPLIPPRTYPQPLPSNLPALLIGVARIFSWIAGGSAALLLIYFRFLYPRIAQTSQARHALRVHQKDLLGKLAVSIESLRATQAETSALLPCPMPAEDILYGEHKTLDEVIVASEAGQDVPDVTLLRCGLADLTVEKKQTTPDSVLLLLEAKLPWLRGDEGQARREQLWRTLTTSPMFRSDSAGEASIWYYVPPTPPPPVPLMQSVYGLKASLASHPAQGSRFQHTLNALTDLTGYIATRTYDTFRIGSEAEVAAPGVEEEVKREIRALKGLVLNRCV